VDKFQKISESEMEYPYNEKESFAKVAKRIEKNREKVGQLGLTSAAPPICPKQLRFDRTFWKTCQRLLMELQSRNMLKLLHHWMESPHF
jgi:hypothetical protein